MSTAQTILQYVQDATHQYGPDQEEKQWRAIATAARRVARAHAWTWLKRSVALSYDDDDTAGMLMPANMIDVIGPIIDNDGQHYEQIDSSQVKNPPSPDGYYYAYDAGVVAALKDADGVSIDKGSTALTFSPAHGVSDPDGEFISLTDADGLDWGMYEMASASALEDTYWGGRINGGHYIIRPPTARRLSLYNGAGDRVTTTVNVEYWVYPQPMTAKHIFFPDQWEDALRLAAWIETMTDTVDTKGESVRTSRQKEYEVALGFAMIADGKAPMRDLKRDNRGKTRRMGWR